MSVIDDIKNTFAAQKAAGYPGGSQQPQGGSTTVPRPQQPVTPAPAPQPQQLSFVDLYKKFNTYNPPTQEQVAEQERKQKRDTLFAKLGNGFNAFQQAYAAARGTKPLTQDTDYVGKTRDRYEKLTKERDALSREYANGMLRAAQMDQEQGNWREKMGYQKERDAKADERDQRNFDYQVGQDKQKQENWQKTFDRQSEQWKQEFEARERQYGRQDALAWANHNLAKQRTPSGVRGKRIAFSDGGGNEFGIYENVWKGSMQQVYDAIAADFEAQRNNGNANVPAALPKKATAQQKDDYVKQHWQKSATGRNLMQALAGIDPANMSNNSGSYDQYEVSQDNYSQYEVK